MATSSEWIAFVLLGIVVVAASGMMFECGNRIVSTESFLPLPCNRRGNTYERPYIIATDNDS
jgi:hypothetical protein